MKQAIVLCLTALLFIATYNSGVTQTIVGSAHDFSGRSWGSDQICVFCHTPHNGMTPTAGEPLWNHASTAATFTVYSSSTLNATVGQPDASSKLCLSCHDGTIAIDSYGSRTGSNMISGTALLGTNITNDHPVSFLYDAALATADGELYNPTTQSSGIGGTIQTKMLFQDKMQCASCHDVHNGTGISHMLLKSNGSSALCLTCHDK